MMANHVKTVPQCIAGGESKEPPIKKQMANLEKKKKVMKEMLYKPGEFFLPIILIDATLSVVQ